MLVFHMSVFLAGIVGTYSLYKIMCTFYFRPDENKRKIVCTLFFWYVITSVMTIIIHNFWITIVVSMAIVLYMAMLFERKWSKAFFVTYFIHLLKSVLNGSIILYGECNTISDIFYVHYTSIIEVVAGSLLEFVMIMYISNFLNKKKETQLPKEVEMTMLIVPLSSIYLILKIGKKLMRYPYEFMMFTTIILLINFIVFYLYERLNIHYEKSRITDAANILNNSYEQQLELVQDENKKRRKIVHDVKGHINSIRTLVMNKEIHQAIEYIDKFTESMGHNPMIVNTGNMLVDSVINVELKNLQVDKVDFSFKENGIYNGPKIHAYDLTILLSNMVRNAVEAVENGRGNKFIYITLKGEKGMLFIKVENTYDGYIKRKNGQIVTRKADEKYHGIGLGNMEEIVKKYNGMLEVKADTEVFSVAAILYEEE